MNTEKKSYQENLKDLRDNLGNMLPKEALAIFDNDAESLQVNHNSILKLQEGEKAPDFSLTNAKDKTVRLSELLKKEKVVLTFYRGSWCPYCNLQLSHYQKSLDEIHDLGAELVAISSQTPDESLNVKEKNELNFEVLSDNGNMVARQYTTVFKNADAPVNTMTELGFDFDAHYSDDSRELPIPAVFVIEKDSTVSFAKSLGGDYRNRVEASEIINHLKNVSK
ncbi:MULTISPECIES: peroxiredoxin-like family protein [Flagellimonas]|jgi:peroxiredoxin|uniref:thioredoxin-dependent peroxiredoxin n=1 Tax=Flagellimonas sp. MMG031 TaxID=3158549 RepID=A0AAU7MYI1_9FLAO|nr:MULTISPECIES: peroxiredoxin-like family protein [Allomuricauda]USD26161.1 AhpC/TSA family protein [Allomuricauda aquimarina]